GYDPAGSRVYISFLGSPSIPPKVILGLLGVKNQTEPDLIMYQVQAGTSGAYINLKGHASQFLIFFIKFFK
ncbi:MAG: hypothetical protein ABIT58_06420, partial [Ferruginibacter sp.]